MTGLHDREVRFLEGDAVSGYLCSSHLECLHSVIYRLFVMRLILFTLVFIVSIATQATSQPDFERLYKTALIAAATYTQYEDAKINVESAGWKLERHYELPQTAVQYLLISNDREQVIAIRGTANAENVMVDLDLQLEPEPTLGIELHKGFALAAKSVWQDVAPRINRNKPIRTTGHSLGGAVAVVLAMHLDKAGYQLTDTTTFGQPKVTNVQGARAFEHLPLTRVVTPLDIVPIVPPLSPLELKRLDIYWHGGEEIILQKEGVYSRTQGIKSMLRAAKFIDKVPDETNLHAHEMQTYLSLLKSNIETSEEVPYKMELNLFGFTVD